MNNFAQTDSVREFKARDIVRVIARMQQYTIDSSDDALEDAVATLNRLIFECRKLEGEG